MRSLVLSGWLAAACVSQPPPQRPPTPPPEKPEPDGAAVDAAPPFEDPRVVEARTIDAAKEKLRALGVTLYVPRHKDDRPFPPSEGYLAPVAPVADGYLYSGLVDEHVVIGKRDAEWNVVWELTYEKKGFRAYEGGQLGEDGEGDVIAYVPSYPNPAENPTYRLVKLRADGTILWELQLARDKHGNSAQIHFGQIGDDGSLYLQGHIYQGKRSKTDRPALRWSATVTADGALTGETIGNALDWAIDEW
jgi:hypothetical protein